jgi:uncharacterized protein YcbX
LGRSSSFTASQFTPFSVLSKWESRTIRQAASNVSTPCETCAMTTVASAKAVATNVATPARRMYILTSEEP